MNPGSARRRTSRRPTASARSHSTIAPPRLSFAPDLITFPEQIGGAAGE
ncbi:MAG: hypothetical protein ABSB59_08295 [Streptosporangiaceae bacterium]